MKKNLLLLLLLFSSSVLFASQQGVVYNLDPNGDGFLFIRTKPQGKEIGKLHNGDKVNILSSDGKWYKVKLLDSGQVGWVHGNWIRVEEISDTKKSTEKKETKNNFQDIKIENNVDKALEHVKKKEFKQARVLLAKESKKGNADAQYILGLMYDKGQGVKKNKHKAMQLYKKACNNGLNDGCNKVGSTKLFDVYLKTAIRDDFWNRVNSTKLSIKSQTKNNWCDVYYSDRALKGSSTLTVCYTYNDKFAYAQYKFPSFMDTQQVAKVKNILVNKYNEPQQSHGRVNLGRVSYIWTMDDGIGIEVYRGWPSTTTYLTYTHPKNYREMKREQEEEKKEREKKMYEPQSNAF